MQLTLKGFRARRVRVQRRLRELQHRRALYIARADNLAAPIEARVAEIAKIDAAIAAMADFDAYFNGKPKRDYGPRAKRNAHLDQAIIDELTKAGRDGIGRDELYEALASAGIALPASKSFAPHLSFMARTGQIASRKFKWMLAALAPPLPPPAIEEAERLILERGALSRPEIEVGLKTRDIPFTQKSLQTQLSERIRTGKLAFEDGKYRMGTGV